MILFFVINTALIIEITGWVSAFIFLLAYFLVSNKYLKGTSLEFQMLNITSSLGLLISTIYNKAYPSSVVNAIVICIACYSLVKHKEER